MADEPRRLTEEELRAAVGPMKAPPPPKGKGRRGASKEWMAEMTRRRNEMAKLDPSKKGGRPRTRYSKREIEERKIEELLPRALRVLEEQLDDKDARVRQAAAIKVMEYVKGRPSQTVKMEGSQVHTIRYETVALEAADVIDLPDAQEVMDELEAGDG